MSSTDTNQLIQLDGPDPAQQEELQMDDVIRLPGHEFPKACDMSAARNIYNTVYDHTGYIRELPDNERISGWKLCRNQGRKCKLPVFFVCM